MPDEKTIKRLEQASLELMMILRGAEAATGRGLFDVSDAADALVLYLESHGGRPDDAARAVLELVAGSVITSMLAQGIVEYVPNAPGPTLPVRFVNRDDRTEN